MFTVARPGWDTIETGIKIIANKPVNSIMGLQRAPTRIGDFRPIRPIPTLSRIG
jgi:hypothetical protein